ncbi:peptide deformylase [Candidatus Parcubacteria bacterium]|nr:peptide deformylase [Candidatus Parcubacteria bacterium]
MNKTIVNKDNPILREIAKPVEEKDLGSKKILNILNKMRRALYSEEDGVAIAAPQVGESLRMFMVRGDILKANSDPNITNDNHYQDLVFINPEIIRASKKKRPMDEGCLSVRWLYGKVERSEKVKIKAWDEKGQKIEVGSSGLMAQIFQHEIDHLNGILFIDKAVDVQDLPPKSKKVSSKKKSKDE